MRRINQNSVPKSQARMLHRADTTSYSRRPHESAYAPYTPRFQPPYRYPIALPHPPKAGESYWPGQLPPTIPARAAPTFYPSQAYGQFKDIRSRPLMRSHTMPAPYTHRSFGSHRDADAVQPRHSGGPRTAGTVSLSPLLVYSPSTTTPALHYNLEFSSAYARLSSASMPLSTQHRALPATSPPVPLMRIRCDLFPWVVEIPESAPGAGVRVGDVLDAISRKLWQRLRARRVRSWAGQASTRVPCARRSRWRKLPCRRARGCA